MTEPQLEREPRNLVLRARNVRFDWQSLPLHYVAGDAFATHWTSVLHMLLPAGERWFAKVFSEALPLIRDDKLRRDVLGFIGQEAMHASAHQSAQDRLREQGLDSSEYVAELEWFFQDRLGDRGLAGRDAEEWLIERLGLIASIEHVTAVLGHWILNASALDERNVHPGMLDLLRWHGAEEVEHRSVAYDLFRHLDSRYVRRIRPHIVILPILLWLWARGMSYLYARDPALAPQRVAPRWRDWLRVSARGLLPRPIAFLWAYLSYFRPGFHPEQECSTSQAVAYLAASPAAQGLR